MAISFPTPNLGDPSTLTVTQAGITWTWNDTLQVWSTDPGEDGSAYWDRTDTTLSPKTENDNIDIGTGTVTAGDGQFSGDVSGTFTGDLTGSVTGDVTGDVTGNLTGDVTGNVSGSSGSCTGNAATATTATNCSRTITAGNGLGGGGALTANRTISVGQGSGISVSSSTVAVDSTVERTNTSYVANVGSSGAPAHTFNGKTNAGMYFGDTNEVRIATGGVRRATFSSGVFECPGVYNNTAGDSTVCVSSSGRLRRKSSSRTVKTNIESLENAYVLNILNNAQPVWYRFRVPDPEYPQQYLDFIANSDDAEATANVYGCLEYCQENGIAYELGDKWMNEGVDPTHSRYGFIAEDLGLVDPRLCVYDDSVQDYVAVHYDEFSPVLLKINQIQRDQIADLEERLATLEAANTLESVYSTLADLPDASNHHGKVTHVHSEGALYFAHAGSWVKLQNAS